MTNSTRGIELLRKVGFKVYVYHQRRIVNDERKHQFYEDQHPAKTIEWTGGYYMSPRGGKTLVDIFDRNGDLVATGLARCSESDNFCRRRGRDIAFGRALKEWESSFQQELEGSLP